MPPVVGTRAARTTRLPTRWRSPVGHAVAAVRPLRHRVRRQLPDTAARPSAWPAAAPPLAARGAW
jgi:hypothetical protein